MTAEFAPCGVPLIGTNCQKSAMQREIESLRSSLTRVEEERDEAVRALEPFAKARPTETGFDPADGDALFSTRHHNPIGLHEWVIARDLHTRLSRAISTGDKTP